MSKKAAFKQLRLCERHFYHIAKISEALSVALREASEDGLESLKNLEKDWEDLRDDLTDLKNAEWIKALSEAGI